MTTTFCMAEDRQGAEIGIKLALLSLARHRPGAEVVLFRPRSAPGFAEWLSRFPAVELVTTPLQGATDWNCKPQALQAVLHRPGPVDRQVIWLDSDLMLTRDPLPLFQGLNHETLGLTQEPVNQPHRGTEIRTRGWELPIGRSIPDSLNSCVIRVTRHHLPLLRRWEQFLLDPRYTSVARLPQDQKPPHLWSDQDVLAALLGSCEFADLPIRMLAHGREILHCGGALGFTLRERILGIPRPVPTVLHAIAGKPWCLLPPNGNQPGAFGWFRRLLQETSPYVVHARQHYRNLVDEPMPWLDHRTVTGTLLRIAGLGHWALRGLPITTASTVARAFGFLRPERVNGPAD